MRLSKRQLLVGLAMLTAGTLPTPSTSQTYPSRTIRIIVSTPAGGPQDALARAIGQSLSSSLGQPVIIENRPGANTMLAAQLAADAPADGYTLLMVSDSTMSINPHLYSKIAYNPENFAALSRVIDLSHQLYVNADLPARNVRELIELAKAKPGTLNYGSYGHGSSPHLEAEEFSKAAGIHMVHIPYKGAQDSLPALAGNQTQVMFGSLGPALPLVHAGKIRALAVSGKRRAESLPDVPTLAEAGFPQLEFNAWFGLVVRKETPEPIVQLLSENIVKYVKSDAFAEIAKRFRWEVVGSSAADFAEFLRNDREKYRRIIAESKIAPIN